MLPEVKAAESTLKQMLYGCVEHVQATKAALYLACTPDLNEKVYELVTSYQFNDPERKVVKETDEVVDRLVTKRNAFFLNGLGSDQKFSEILFRQSTDRILAAPLYSRGRLVGFIDMRDKAAKKDFAESDVRAAKKIVDEILAFLGSKKLYGIGPVQLVHEPTPRPGGHAPAAPRATSSSSPALEVPTAPDRAEHAIEAAREMLSRRQHRAGVVKRPAAENDADTFRLLLPAALAIPGAVIAAVSVHGSKENPLAIVALAQVADDARVRLDEHLRTTLQEADQPHSVVRRPVSHPFGPQAVPVTAATITAVATSPIAPQHLEGLLLTVAFERTADAQAERAVRSFLKQMETAVDAGVAITGRRVDRMVIAEKLLEPDFERHPELVTHCREVANIASKFAMHLGLTPAQVDTIRIAAFVHDVGLRLLDYERLFHRKLSPEDMRTIHEHPTIGAALVEPLLGGEVAQAVLRHHERADGAGYPSGLPGAKVPLTSKVIQIADAWVAMTSPHSYQERCEQGEAAKRLREAAGTQFDQPLVTKFLEALPQFEE